MAITVNSYTLNLFPGERPDVFYLPGSAEEGQAVFAALPQPRPALVCIDGIDWDRELSPWPAPRAFKGGNDFGGEAAAFFETLEKQLIPAAEQELGFTPESRGLAGYSLGGLFTLWAMGQTEVFQRFASMSGSVWYDDFLDYFSLHLPQKAPLKVSISLGDGEKKTKNQRMARVETCTLAILEQLKEQNIPVFYRSESGGHFNDVNGRIARGITGAF